MWFLIRSAFWLSLVFARINWPVDTPAIPDSGAIASAAAAGVASLCAEHPVPCARAARQTMSALPSAAAETIVAPPPQAEQFVPPARKSRRPV